MNGLPFRVRAWHVLLSIAGVCSGMLHMAACSDTDCVCVRETRTPYQYSSGGANYDCETGGGPEPGLCTPTKTCFAYSGSYCSATWDYDCGDLNCDSKAKGDDGFATYSYSVEYAVRDRPCEEYCTGPWCEKNLESPTVSWVSPLAGARFTAGATVAIHVSVSDPDGVYSVTLSVDGAELGPMSAVSGQSSYNYEYSWQPADGTYSLEVKAVDNFSTEANRLTGSSGSRTVTVGVPPGSPSVDITSPAQDAAFASGVVVAIAAAVTDPDNDLNQVEFFVGGTSIGRQTQISPTNTYSVEWTAPSVTVATTYVARVVGTDRGGKTGSDEVSITVGPPYTGPPTAIVLEPVTCEIATGEYANPSGVGVVGTGTYRIAVEPPQLPDAGITWATSSSDITMIDGVGREVLVLGKENPSGQPFTLTATIAGNPGPAPVVKGIVLPWSEVKVYVCIVKGTDGVAVLSQDALAAIAVEVNRIYRQAGMRFVFQQASVEVAGDAWKTLDFSRQPQRLIDLLNKQPSTGGLELYVLEQFLRDGQPIPGGDFPEGAVLATKTTGQSNTVAEMADGLAHELGHACGLPDIYSYYGIYDDAGNLVQFCQLEPDGVKPCEDYQKDDWSGTATTSYCAASLTQAVLIDRLVMNGYRTSETWDGKDISLGSVWGVWYEWTTSSKVCGEGTCDVGVMRRNASTGQLEPNMVRSPSHQ